MNVRKSERGQAVVLMVLSLVVLLGMSALVLDVGSWFQSKRHLQGTADASALAGAQMLPENWTGAQGQAMAYAAKNGGDVNQEDVTSSTTYVQGDTISVTARRQQPTIFSAVFGLDSVNITANASALRGSYTGWALGLAPWVIDKPSVKYSQIITFKVQEGSQAAPGNFGGVDLQVKENGCGWASGANDYYDLIARRTHSCIVQPGENLPVEPGNKAATGTAVKDRGAQQGFDPNSILTTNADGKTEITDYNNPNVIVIPIIKEFHQGSSAPFVLTGYAWFIITSWTSKEVTGMFVHSGAPSSAACPTANDPNAPCPFGAYNPDGFYTVKLIK